MSSNINNLNNLVNTLSSQFNSIITNYTTLENNITNNTFVKNTTDTMTGILNINNIDCNSNLNIGENATNITIGSLTNTDIKTINLNGLNDNLNIGSNLNLNSNKITNISNATNLTDSVNLSQFNSLVDTSIPTKLSQLTQLNNNNININSNKIINVSNPIDNNDAVNVNKLNSLIPTKLSQLTNLNTNDVNLNNYKIYNVTNATDNNDAVNFSQTNTLITNAKPNKLSQLTGLNDSNINLYSYKITNVADPINSTDAANLNYSNTTITTNNPKKLSQLTDLNTSNVNLNSYKITNVKDAVNSSDLINLQQTNTLISNSKSSIPFNKITTFGSDVNNVLLGDETFGKINNNRINDNSLSLSKIVNYPNNNNLLLSGDGTFKTVNIDNTSNIGKIEIFLPNMAPKNGYLRQGTQNISCSDYPILASKYVNYNPADTVNFISSGSCNYPLGFFGNGLFIVFIPNNNYLLYTSDGVNFYASNNFTPRDWKMGAYGNGIYMIISSSMVIISSDGYTWTECNLPMTSSWKYINYNYSPTSKYFFISDGVNIYFTTNNGTTWTSLPFPVSTTDWSFVNIRYDNVTSVYTNVYTTNISKYGYVGNLSTTQKTVTSSTLGITGIPSTTSWKLKKINEILIGVLSNSNYLLVAVGSAGFTKYILPETANYKSIAYGNGYYVLVIDNSQYHYFSNNLINWTPFNINYPMSINDIIWGNDRFLILPTNVNDLYYYFNINYPIDVSYNINTLPANMNIYSVANKNDDYMFFVDGTTNLYITYDGINWKKTDWAETTFGIYNYIYYDGNIFHIALNSGVYLLFSLELQMYCTNTTFPYSNSGPRFIMHGNGSYVAFDNYTISQSIRWTFSGAGDYYGRSLYKNPTFTTINLPVSLYWTSGTFGNDIFIVMSNTQTYLTSNGSGSNWTQRTLPIATAYSWYIKYVNNRFVLISSGGNYCLTSTDGINWTTNYLPMIHTWNGIAYGNGYYLIGSGSSGIVGTNLLAYSRNTIDWYLLNIDSSIIRLSNTCNIAFFENSFYVFSNSSYTPNGNKYISITFNINSNASSNTTFNLPSITEDYLGERWIIAG